MHDTAGREGAALLENACTAVVDAGGAIEAALSFLSRPMVTLAASAFGIEAAAELAVPEKSELLRRHRELEQALRSGLKRHLEKLNQNIKDLKRRLVDPRRKIQELWLRLDDFSSRIKRLTALSVRRDKERLCG